MGARKNRGTSEQGWDQSVRDRIKTTMIVKRLQDHIAGEIDLKPTQITAANILLNKTIPNLSQSENKTEHLHSYVARIPDKAATADTWQKQHDPHATTH